MAESYTLLMEFTVSDSITKYISTEARSLHRLYTPQILEPPSLELSGEGYVSAGFGSFSIINNPWDSESVFNYPQGTYPVATGAYAVTFKWGNQSSALFTGSAVLREVADDYMRFDLVSSEYSQDLLTLTQNKTNVVVDTVADSAGGSGNTVRITATNHGLDDGSDVIFEDMAVTTELNYDDTSATVYVVSVVDTDTFDLDDTNSDNFTLGSETAGTAGTPEVRRMALGEVTHRVPVAKSSALVVNPGMDASSVTRVYEDGVNIGAGKSTSTSVSVSSVSIGSSTTYTVSSHDFIVDDEVTPSGFSDSGFHVQQTVTAKTSTTFTTDLVSTGFSTTTLGSVDFTNLFSTSPSPTHITLNGDSSGGELSVSGTGVNAVTLYELFDYCCTQLSLTLDVTKASSASSLDLSFYVDSQMKVIDLMDSVAVAVNYQFYIEDSTLYLIDKANDPTATEVIGPDIEFITHEENFPVKQFRSSWTQRVPFTGTDKRLGEESRFQYVNSSNFSVGNVVTIDNFVETEVAQKSILSALQEIYERPLISLRKPEIDFETKIGDKLTFTDQEKVLTYSLYVRSISYDHKEEHTTFSGDGTVTAIIRTNIRS